MIPLEAVGCPIRRSEDHRALAPPLGFSQRATSFIASRCQGIHQMPFLCRARAQPRARGEAACRDQRTEIRGQTRRRGAIHRGAVRDAVLFSVLCDLFSGTGAQAPPRRCSRIGFAYPCPGPISSHKDDDRTCFTVTTRFTIS
jgi:hypothetical protein